MKFLNELIRINFEKYCKLHQKKMKNLNQIGLDLDKTNHLIEKLNQILANYSIFYQNLRGFHWNIKGQVFFELHSKFEELYNDIQEKVDEIAERILCLGGVPIHQYSEYIEKSSISETQLVSDGTIAIKIIIESLKKLLEIQRSLLSIASDAGDDGTNALIGEYIKEEEKLIWMYSSYIGY